MTVGSCFISENSGCCSHPNRVYLFPQIEYNVYIELFRFLKKEKMNDMNTVKTSANVN